MRCHLQNCKSVFLRNITADDATQTYADWLNDPDVNQYLETRHTKQTPESCRLFVETVNARENEHLFAICDQETGRHIGNVKVGPLNFTHQYGDISLFIGDKTCWGCGAGTDAIRTAVAYAFRELNVRRLAAGFYLTNLASINAFKKVGFFEDGLLHERFVTPEGGVEDCLLLGYLKRLCGDMDDLVVIDE